jgi:hypothetical protein
MTASNSPSIRELALAALARQRGKDETPHETTMRQGVSRLYPVSHPHETPLAESNQALHPGVSSSHSYRDREMRRPNNNETPHETAVRQVCAHCGQPGGTDCGYDGVIVRLHPQCRRPWTAAYDRSHPLTPRSQSSSSQ